MEFALSKELRTLGVVQFVYFFINPAARVMCGYIKLCCYNIEFIDFIDLIISALETSTYIAFLALFRRDVRVCDDSLITTVIVLAALTLALKLLNKTLDLLLTKILKRKGKEVDQEALEANVLSHAEKASEMMVQVTEKGDEMLEKLERKKWFGVLAKGLMVIFSFFVIVFVLAGLAWAVFSFATTIKLAIPEDFQTSCVDNSKVSKVIMLGIPILNIGLYVALMSLNVGMTWYMRKINLAEVKVFTLGKKEALITAAVLVPMCLTLGVLCFILFIRLLKVWRGEELELYEYVGLSVCAPLVHSKAPSVEEKQDS